MPKYKKKPVVIEAVQYFEENLEEIKQYGLEMLDMFKNMRG